MTAFAVLTVVMFFGCVKKPTAVDPAVLTVSDSVIVITTGNFDSLIVDSGVTALVEFYSPQCPVCAGMAWVIDSLSRVLGDSAIIGASNSDNDSLWKRFSITTIPSYILFRNGVEITRRAFPSPDSSAVDTLAALLRQLIAGTLTPDTADTSTAPKDTIPSGVIMLDKTNFKEITTVPGRVAMVDFYSPHCGYCIAMESVVADLALQYKDRALIGKVNLDVDDSLKYVFNPSTWPAFVFMQDGLETNRVYGVVPSDSLEGILDSLLTNK